MFSFVRFSLLLCWISLYVRLEFWLVWNHLWNLYQEFLAFHIDELCFFSLETWNCWVRLGPLCYSCCLNFFWLCWTFQLGTLTFLWSFFSLLTKYTESWVLLLKRFWTELGLNFYLFPTALLDQVVQSCWSIHLAAVPVDFMCCNIFAWHLSFST